MTKQNHKTGFLVAAMVFSAILLRVLGQFDILIVPGGIVRSLIYITLYIGWGISVSKRIIQIQVRHYMVSVSGLMVFWFVIRSIKYFFITDIGIIRQLWYWFYLPMLFIPLFSLFVAISLGKPANAKLSKTLLLLLYIPTVLCLLLVLTNDLHQLVFDFMEGKAWTDNNMNYAFGYFFVLGWDILCALAAFIIMLIKCRLSQKKISAVFAAGMFYRICPDICQQCRMVAADRQRYHGSTVSDVHRNIGMLYSVWADPDQYRLPIAV